MAQLKIAIRALLIGVCLSGTSFAQASPDTKPVCDKSPDAVQITFDHVETLAVVNGKPTNVFWLKLRNNSNCEIEIEVPESVGPTLTKLTIAKDKNGEFIRNAKGGFQFERTIKHGDKVPIIYYLSNSGRKSLGTGNLEGCVVYTPTFYPGQEILFPVASTDFKRNRTVEVVFGFVGDIAIPFQPLLQRRAVFAFNDIPQEAIKSKK